MEDERRTRQKEPKGDYRKVAIIAKIKLHISGALRVGIERATTPAIPIVNRPTGSA